MNFSEFLSQAWSRHGEDAEGVASSLESGLSLCKTSEDLTALVNLTTHLYAEHLQRFVEGERKLREFGKNQMAIGTSAEFVIARAAMTFRLCEGSVDPETDRLGLTPGDLARSLAAAASALCARDAARGERYLRLALQTVSLIALSADDGVARALAISGNNIAARLEETSSRGPDQTRLMLLAAETARKFWEISGTWLEVERAEYRLAKSLLAAGRVPEARQHAELCLSICQQNSAAALEFFFAYECLASVEKAAGSELFLTAIKNTRDWFEKIAPDDQLWARASLEALTQK